MQWENIVRKVIPTFESKRELKDQLAYVNRQNTFVARPEPPHMQKAAAVVTIDKEGYMLASKNVSGTADITNMVKGELAHKLAEYIAENGMKIEIIESEDPRRMRFKGEIGYININELEDFDS